MPANPRLANGMASPIGIHASSTTQYHRIGTRGELNDRAFRYYRFTSATPIPTNNLCQAAVPVANHTSETGTLTTPGVTAGGIPAGSKTIVATIGASQMAPNEYEDGYFKVQAGTGLGQIYKIKGHPLYALSTGATLELYDPVLTTIADGATWSLIPNPWADIIVTPVTTRTGMAVGVVSHALAANTVNTPVYGWIQTWGPCSILGDTSNHAVATGTFASVVVGSSGIAVENDVIDRIGVSMETLATDTVYQTVYLQIAP